MGSATPAETMFGGELGIRVEHLQLWLVAATREQQSEKANWDRVMDIIRTEIKYGRLSEECTCQTVIRITKGNGEFKEIVLIKVLWKALSGVLKRQIGAAV